MTGAPGRRRRPGRRPRSSPCAALVVGAALVSTVVFVVCRGLASRCCTSTSSSTTWPASGPRTRSTAGGIAHAIVGSAIELGIAIAVTLPLGIGTAVFMTEVGGTLRHRRAHHRRGDDRAALDRGRPVHLHGAASSRSGFPRSGFAAALALSVMMLPIIARAADVVLRVVPGGLREASLALGASRWRTVWHVVLPTARPGLATAVILGVARGVGETSARCCSPPASRRSWSPTRPTAS